MSDTKVIVVTLVKDEAWMLDRFLATCSQFADHIIVSDESSGLDNSLEIYKKYPKVILHHNAGTPVRGDIRRNFVFEEARKIPCNKRIIIAIDSDEILSANLLESPEWQTVLNAEPGTLIHLQWVTLWKNYSYYRIEAKHTYGHYNRQIWVDDGISGIPTIGHQEMHMAYNPLQAKKHIYLHDIVCLHYQFCNWNRMEAKHRYYRAHEKADIRKLSDLAIYRIYGYMSSKKVKHQNCLTKWYDGWTQKGIDMSSVGDTELTHFDLSVLELFKKHGTDYFSRQNLWKADWERLCQLAKEQGVLSDDFDFTRPRKSVFFKMYHSYMKATIDIKLIRSLEKKLFPGGFSY